MSSVHHTSAPPSGQQLANTGVPVVSIVLLAVFLILAGAAFARTCRNEGRRR